MTGFDYGFVIFVLVLNYLFISRRLATKINEDELRLSLKIKENQVVTMEKVAETLAIVIQNSQMTVDMQNIMVTRLNHELKSKEALLTRILAETQAKTELQDMSKGSFN